MDTDNLLAEHQQVTDCQPPVHLQDPCWPGFGWTVPQILPDCWSSVGQKLADRFLHQNI